MGKRRHSGRVASSCCARRRRDRGSNRRTPGRRPRRGSASSGGGPSRRASGLRIALSQACSSSFLSIEGHPQRHTECTENCTMLPLATVRTLVEEGDGLPRALKKPRCAGLSRMRMRGLEPPPGFPDTDLNRARLPIPPHPRAGERANDIAQQQTNGIGAGGASFGPLVACSRPIARRYRPGD